MASGRCNCESGCTGPDAEHFVDCGNDVLHEHSHGLLHATCAKALGDQLVHLISGDAPGGKTVSLEGVDVHSFCSLECVRTAVHRECDRDHAKPKLTALRRVKNVLRRVRWDEGVGEYVVTEKQ